MAETDVKPSVGEKVLLMVGLAVAAAVAQRVVKVGWVVATGSNPPDDPGDPGVQIGEALTVAALTAVTAAVLRTLVSRRVTARSQRRAVSAA
ncbi:MAG: DUF4235 domain-containing protein [Actinomycetia bacterium]|jgi:hypothetical protein|nr:DUF4235 domain-containing protein [Actinomycetes bacterium]